MYQSYKTDYSTESDNGIGYFVSLMQNFITEYVRRAGRMKNRKCEISLSLPYGQKQDAGKEASARGLAAGIGITPGQDRQRRRYLGRPSGKKFIIP